MFIDCFKLTGGVLLMKRNLCFVLMLAMAFMAPGLWAQIEPGAAASVITSNEPGAFDDDDLQPSIGDLTVDSDDADRDIGIDPGDRPTNDLPSASPPNPGDQPTNDLPRVSPPNPGDRPTNDLPGVTEPGPGASAPSPGATPVSPELQRLRNMRQQVQRMIRQRMFTKAAAKLQEIEKLVKASKLSEERKNTFMASVSRHEQVALHSAQGQYQKAADAIRQAIALKENKNDKARLLKVQEKVGLQKEWFEIRANHEKELKKLIESKTPLLKQKLDILKQLDSKKKLDDAEMKKLQAALKAINEKLQPINKQLEETRRVFAVKRDKMRKAGVVLNAAQHAKLFPLVMKRMLARFANYNLHKQIARHLGNISENKEVTWKDLKENFTALAKLQDEIYRLRKELVALSGKAPLSPEDYKTAKEMRARLERLMDKSEKLMNKVEDAFVDQKTFGKLSAKEKLEFVKLFREVWKSDREFENLKPSLEDLYKKLFETPPPDGLPVEPITPDPIRPDPITDPRPTEPIPLLNGAGMIIQEGNVFVLQFENRLYYPTNLPRQYMVNRLEVKFAATVETITTQEAKLNPEWWEKLTAITFTYVHAPQLPDQPFERPADMATPTEVIEENIDNQNRPSNLMNAF